MSRKEKARACRPGPGVKVSKRPLPDYITPKSELGQAWGEYLSGLASWDWWVTLTFRDPVPSHSVTDLSCHGWFFRGKWRFPDPSSCMTPRSWNRPGWTYAKRGWRDALAALPGPAVGTFPWVRAFEIQKWRGAPHIHALVGGLDSKRYAEFGTWWWQKYGFCKVEEYDPARGAGYYLCKYVAKTFGDIEFGPYFPVSKDPTAPGVSAGDSWPGCPGRGLK